MEGGTAAAFEQEDEPPPEFTTADHNSGDLEKKGGGQSGRSKGYKVRRFTLKDKNKQLSYKSGVAHGGKTQTIDLSSGTVEVKGRDILLTDATGRLWELRAQDEVKAMGWQASLTARTGVTDVRGDDVGGLIATDPLAMMSGMGGFSKKMMEREMKKAQEKLNIDGSVKLSKLEQKMFEKQMKQMGGKKMMRGEGMMGRMMVNTLAKQQKEIFGRLENATNPDGSVGQGVLTGGHVYKNKSADAKKNKIAGTTWAIGSFPGREGRCWNMLMMNQALTDYTSKISRGMMTPLCSYCVVWMSDPSKWWACWKKNIIDALAQGQIITVFSSDLNRAAAPCKCTACGLEEGHGPSTGYGNAQFHEIEWLRNPVDSKVCGGDGEPLTLMFGGPKKKHQVPYSFDLHVKETPMDKMYADLETLAAGHRASGMGGLWDAQMEQVDQGEFVQSKGDIKKAMAESAKGFETIGL
eukprot:COSAG01_NODE_3137_length_6528_cov_3.708819_4_plen_465_part_00